MVTMSVQDRTALEPNIPKYGNSNAIYLQPKIGQGTKQLYLKDGKEPLETVVAIRTHAGPSLLF